MKEEKEEVQKGFGDFVENVAGALVLTAALLLLWQIIGPYGSEALVSTTIALMGLMWTATYVKRFILQSSLDTTRLAKEIQLVHLTIMGMVLVALFLVSPQYVAYLYVLRVILNHPMKTFFSFKDKTSKDLEADRVDVPSFTQGGWLLVVSFSFAGLISYLFDFSPEQILNLFIIMQFFTVTNHLSLAIGRTKRKLGKAVARATFVGYITLSLSTVILFSLVTAHPKTSLMLGAITAVVIFLAAIINRIITKGGSPLISDSSRNYLTGSGRIGVLIALLAFPASFLTIYVVRVIGGLFVSGVIGLRNTKNVKLVDLLVIVGCSVSLAVMLWKFSFISDNIYMTFIALQSILVAMVFSTDSTKSSERSITK